MYNPVYNNFNQAPYQRPFSQPMQRTKCFPVSSYDEVKSAMIDFDGSVTVFTDFANGVIYTKGANADGTAYINMYALTQPQAPVDPLEARVRELERAIDELRGGFNNEQNYTAEYIGNATADQPGDTANPGDAESNGRAGSAKRK